MIRPLPSPWHTHFDQLVRTARCNLLLASPYIARPAIHRLLHNLPSREAPTLNVHVLTDLAVPSLVEGSIEPAALIDLLDALPRSTVTLVPRLHAKVYLADTSAAIVTSANLTRAGLLHNQEYGVLLQDPPLVRTVRADLEAYARLGNVVSRARLQAIKIAAEEMQQTRSRLMTSARATLRREFESRVEHATTEVLHAQAEGRTTNSIFCETILYLLERHGPLATRELHPLLQAIHPDLCDDSMDRVIAGVHFGKLWKHYVRNAQQFLKRRGLITFDGHRWRLSPHHS